MTVVRLWHGTDEASANDILQHGLVAALAAQHNVTGEFWATCDPVTAEWFAKTNPAGGQPALLFFDVPDTILQQLLAQRPLVAQWVAPNDYEFLPPCFGLLNQSMLNAPVVLVP